MPKDEVRIVDVDDLLPKKHPRHDACRKARVIIEMAIVKAQTEHHITAMEEVQILHELMLDPIKGLIRHERRLT